VKVEASVVIERPVEAVFRFYAHEHVRNHPRWDPEMALEPTSPGPIGVGTVIRRRNSRSGVPVEGTMTITEFEPERAMSGVIREGGFEIRGGATFEALGPDRTRLTIGAEMPWLTPGSDSTPIARSMERSVRNIKELIEAET
jgi:hypothetical protein